MYLYTGPVFFVTWISSFHNSKFAYKAIVKIFIVILSLHEMIGDKYWLVYECALYATI